MESLLLMRITSLRQELLVNLKKLVRLEVDSHSLLELLLLKLHQMHLKHQEELNLQLLQLQPTQTSHRLQLQMLSTSSLEEGSQQLHPQVVTNLETYLMLVQTSNSIQVKCKLIPQFLELNLMKVHLVLQKLQMENQICLKCLWLSSCNGRDKKTKESKRKEKLLVLHLQSHLQVEQMESQTSQRCLLLNNFSGKDKRMSARRRQKLKQLHLPLPRRRNMKKSQIFPR